MNFHRMIWFPCWAVIALSPPLTGAAQQTPITENKQLAPLFSGVYTNDGAAEIVVFSTLLRATNAHALRVRFSDCQLGIRSHLRLTSTQDGATQRLDHVSIEWWQNTSVWFNGAEVRLELVAAPGEAGLSARVSELVTRCDCPTFRAANLCGSDDRVSVSDNRVGRLGGCTAWLLSNGAVLTAGHCAPSTAVFEVNVPASLVNGTTVVSRPEDQFPVDAGSWTFFNNGTGDDWAVFRLNPNGITGQFPHARHGFFRPSQITPVPAASTIRVMGYGLDNTPVGSTGGNNAQNATLQSATGPFAGEFGGGNDVEHHYRVDTQPGDSGSPLEWIQTGYTVGIHTTGACADDPFSFNIGTSFNNSRLASTLENFASPDTRYMDQQTPGGRTGSLFQPWQRLSSAVPNMPDGGTLSIVAGSYTAGDGNALTISKPMKLIAPVGPVILGN